MRAATRTPDWLAALLLIYLLGWALAIARYFWHLSWPTAEHNCEGPAGFNIYIPLMLLGAVGGILHGLSSLGQHMGKGDATTSWWVFYLARPFLGGGLALLVYFPLKSGFAGVKLLPGCDGLYSALAWAGLIGLFSQSGLDKLRDIFFAMGNSTGPRAPADPPKKLAEPSEGSEAIPDPAAPPKTS